MWRSSNTWDFVDFDDNEVKGTCSDSYYVQYTHEFSNESYFLIGSFPLTISYSILEFSCFVQYYISYTHGVMLNITVAYYFRIVDYIFNGIKNSIDWLDEIIN